MIQINEMILAPLISLTFLGLQSLDLVLCVDLSTFRLPCLVSLDRVLLASV
jgi:hypothetical protein